jgi:hypothetical protein
MNGPIDYDAPLAGTAHERDDAKNRAIGVRVDEASALARRLNTDISADAWGYRQFDDLADELQRAVVSDQLRSAAQGLAENLVEARLHERAVRELVGPNGVPMAGQNASLNDHLLNDNLELNVVGFFRAFGSALDCLAAVLIGVLRVPMSLQYADMGRLSRFDPQAPGRDAPDPLEDTQRHAWAELADLLRAERERDPSGWYVWGLETRNALLHRGRGLKAFLPRPISGRLMVVSNESPAALYRYDYYLRRRPWLPGIVQLARANGPGGVWLHEPAQDTLAGLFERLNEMVEQLAAWALARWDDQEQARNLVAPERAWKPVREVESEFGGFGEPTAPTSFTALVVNTQDTEQLGLAEKLRLWLLDEQSGED